MKHYPNLERPTLESLDTSWVRSQLEISFAAFRDLTRWDWTDSTIRSLLTPGFHHMAIVDHVHWTRCVHTSCKTKGSHNAFISLNQLISNMCLPHGCSQRLWEFVFLKSNVGNNQRKKLRAWKEEHISRNGMWLTPAWHVSFQHGS